MLSYWPIAMEYIALSGYAFYNTIGGFVNPTHNTVYTFSSTCLTAVNSSVREHETSTTSHWQTVQRPNHKIIIVCNNSVSTQTFYISPTDNINRHCCKYLYEVVSFITLLKSSVINFPHVKYQHLRFTTIKYNELVSWKMKQSCYKIICIKYVYNRWF